MCSPEAWSLLFEALAVEFQRPAVFGDGSGDVVGGTIGNIGMDFQDKFDIGVLQ